MDGYAAGISFRFVDRYRDQLSELRTEAAELDRRVVEAWFQCLAFTDDEDFADDLREARHERDETERRQAASLGRHRPVRNGAWRASSARCNR